MIYEMLKLASEDFYSCAAILLLVFDECLISAFAATSAVKKEQ
jgi:hypothetical protein